MVSQLHFPPSIQPERSYYTTSLARTGDRQWTVPQRSLQIVQPLSTEAAFNLSQRLYVIAVLFTTLILNTVLVQKSLSRVLTPEDVGLTGQL